MHARVKRLIKLLSLTFETRIAGLKRMPEICSPLEGRCDHSRRSGFLLISSFEEKSLVKICLVSHNFDVTKVHLMAVFVDIASNLGVVVKQRDSLLCTAIRVFSCLSV